MSEYKEYQQRLIETMRDANFALWNAVLTLNGIFISVFSAVAVFSPTAKLLSIIIIGISMVSALCVVLNFRSIRNQYKFIGELFGQLNEHGEHPFTPQQLKEHNSASVRRHAWCGRREAASLYILAVQAVLILVLIYFKS